MSFTRTQYPAGHCFLNQVPPVVITAENAVNATLYVGPNGQGTEIFQGRYVPDFNGKIRIDLTELVKDCLKSALPANANDYEQTEFEKEFNLGLAEDNGPVTETRFKVANIVCNTTRTLETWCASNFLTQQASEKHTNREQPEWLTYLDLDGDYTLKARFYKKSGGVEDVAVRTDTAAGCYTVNVCYDRLIRMASLLPGQLKGYYDLVLFDGNSTALARQRYLYHERSGREHYYVFVNSFGGIDTLVADGANTLCPEMSLNYGRLGSRYVAVDDTDNVRKWRQAFSVAWRERDWVHGLMAARGEAAAYDAGAMAYEPVVVVDAEISMPDSGQLATGTFDYILAQATPVIQEREERSDTFTQSAADASEDLYDETTSVVVEFSEGATEPVTVPAETLWVLFDDKTNAAVQYYIEGVEEGSFTPGEDDSPFRIEIKGGESVHFETEGTLASLELRYYPVTTQSV